MLVFLGKKVTRTYSPDKQRRGFPRSQFELSHCHRPAERRADQFLHADHQSQEVKLSRQKGGRLPPIQLAPGLSSEKRRRAGARPLDTTGSSFLSPFFQEALTSAKVRPVIARSTL